MPEESSYKKLIAQIVTIVLLLTCLGFLWNIKNTQTFDRLNAKRERDLIAKDIEYLRQTADQVNDKLFFSGPPVPVYPDTIGDP